MINIRQLFKDNEHLMGLHPVVKLIEYCQELEGEVMDKRIKDNYDKEHILNNMLRDILISCKDYEDNKILEERYPELYKKIDADTLIKNLMDYILNMKYNNNLDI